MVDSGSSDRTAREHSREALGVEALRKAGFPASFAVEGERLRVTGTDRTFPPERVRIADHYRFEGTSDPDDMAVVYALVVPPLVYRELSWRELPGIFADIVVVLSVHTPLRRVDQIIEAIDTLLPGHGVYAARAIGTAGAWRAAVNIGPNPTFGEQAVKVEAHLIGFSGSLYGQPLELEFLSRLRSIRPFESVEKLKQQLAADVAAAKAIATDPTP